jgi:peptidoglycan/LPS O-acetylase OafA/YrhL
VKAIVPFSKTYASVSLDAVRGLAALAVLVDHSRNLTFVDFPQATSHHMLWFPFYALCTAGHQAVVIFFVLSGYLISGSIFRMIRSDSWSWKTYLTHRLIRLWIVLIPGLLLCALWDGIGLHSHLAPLLYAGASGTHMMGDVSVSYTFPAFFKNLLFLQTILSPTFGSDVSLWSLANEFWYYMLFPLGLFALLPRTPLISRLIHGGLFLLIAWFVGRGILFNMLIWLAGTLLAILPVRITSSRTALVASAIYIPVFFGMNRYLPLSPLALDYLLTVFTFAFLWILIGLRKESQQSLAVTFSRDLSRLSFTLYVGHVPLCMLLAALLLGDHRWTATPLHLVYWMGVVAVLLFAAYGTAWLTEFRTDTFRRWIERTLLKTNAAPKNLGAAHL